MCAWIIFFTTFRTCHADFAEQVAVPVLLEINCMVRVREGGSMKAANVADSPKLLLLRGSGDRY